MSDTHSSLGRLAWKCRLTWSSGHGVDVSGVVVRIVAANLPVDTRRASQG